MDGDRVSRGLHLHYPDWRVSYPAFQSHSHYLKLPGIRLSRWKMESAPWFSQWLSCSACCGCSARFQIGRLCCRLMFRAWLCGYWCCPEPSALSPLLPLLPSPLLTRLTVWLDSKPPSLLRSAATAFQQARLILPAFRYRWQTSLKRRVGLPVGLVPVASSPRVCS